MSLSGNHFQRLSKKIVLNDSDMSFIDVDGTTLMKLDGIEDKVTIQTLEVLGDLTVNGTQTTINSTSLSIDDTLIKLGDQNGNLTTDVNCVGIYGEYKNTTSNTKSYDAFYRDPSSKKWNLKTDLTLEPTNTLISGGNAGALVCGSLEVGSITSSGVSSSFISANDTSIRIGTSSISYGVQNVYFYQGTSAANANKYIGAVGAALDNGGGGRLIFQTPTPAGVMNERMRIDSAGHMYFGGKIGTGSLSIAPFYNLQVGYSNTANVLDQTLAVTAGLNKNASLKLIELGTNGTDEAGFQMLYNGGDNTFYLSSNGSSIASAQGSVFGSTVLSAQRDTLNVGIGKAPHATYKLDVNGSINCTSYFANGTAFTSDRRVKNNIEDADIDICYDNIKNVQLRRFEWDQEKTEGQFKDTKCIGIIAQEYELIYPKAIETVSRFGIDDFKMVNYHELYMATIGAVKKLIEQVEKLQSEIRILKN